MKVLFDHQIFSIQRFGGASRYFTELLKRLPRDEWATTTRLSNNIHFAEAQLTNYWNPFPGTCFKGKAILLDYLNRPFTLNKLKNGNYDVFHQTHFGDWCLKHLPSDKKMVMTFHDMNHARFTAMYKQQFRVDAETVMSLQRQSVKRSDRIIAVSQYTKDDLVNMWNVDPRKVTVIHHGIEINDHEHLEKKRVIDYPYILYVGERFFYKNFERFVEAMGLLLSKHPMLRVVCTGRTFNVEEQTLLREKGILERTIQISADENTLKRLYRDAEAFVFPSLSEGFGMPILEAMNQGCPVALSQASCFPEVAGGAGVYFDPYQAEDMSTTVEQLLNDTTFRNQKIELGYKQLEQFSWKKTADKHRALYFELN